MSTLAILVTTAGASAAHAQELEAVTGNLAQNASDRIVVGAGLAVVPTYQGSGRRRTLAVPTIDVVSGPFYINLRSGIGVHVIESKGFALGGGVALMPGYRQRDVPPGVDRLGVGAGARLFASVNRGGLFLTLGGTNGFAGSTKGFIADASLSYPIAISPTLRAVPSIAATWADGRHNNGYFGITGKEAATSGLRPFTGRRGFKDVSAAWMVNYRLNDRLSMAATGGVTSLVGKVADSPLVTRQTQPFGLFSLSYRVGP